MSYGQGWSPPASSGGGPPAGPLVVGAPTFTSSTAYAALPTDSLIVLNGGVGNVTVTLAAASAGVRNGQLVTVLSFDAGGATMAIVPHAGDSIDFGSQINLGEYAAYVTLEASISAGVITWLIVAQSNFDYFAFPLQPALAAGAQGPLSLGTIAIPSGPRFLHSIGVCAPAAVTAGAMTVVITGPSGGPRTVTIQSTGPTQGALTLFNPGNGNELTVPGSFGMAVFTATVSTNAAFAPAMGSPAVFLQAWD